MLMTLCFLPSGLLKDNLEWLQQTSTIHQTSMQTDAAISNRTAQVINEAEYLTDNEKALLYLYFSNRPAEASPLPDMDGNFRKAVFQIALAKLQS
jgi:hypothetical protein